MTTAAILALITAIASSLVELAKAYVQYTATQAGENVVKNADLTKSNAQFQAAAKVSTDVAGMSDTAVATELRDKFQRD